MGNAHALPLEPRRKSGITLKNGPPRGVSSTYRELHGCTCRPINGAIDADELDKSVLPAGAVTLADRYSAASRLRTIERFSIAVP